MALRVNYLYIYFLVWYTGWYVGCAELKPEISEKLFVQLIAAKSDYTFVANFIDTVEIEKLTPLLIYLTQFFGIRGLSKIFLGFSCTFFSFIGSI